MKRPSSNTRVKIALGKLESVIDRIEAVLKANADSKEPMDLSNLRSTQLTYGQIVKHVRRVPWFLRFAIVSNFEYQAEHSYFLATSVLDQLEKSLSLNQSKGVRP